MIALLERVRDARIAQMGPDHADTLTALDGLATTYWSAKQFDKSVPLFEDVLKRRESKFGRQVPSTQMTVADLGVNYKDSGRLKEAIPLLEEAYHASARFPHVLWVGNQLAEVYRHTGKLTEAIAVYERVRDAQIAQLGPDHPDILNTLHGLAETYRDAGKFPEAIALYKHVRDARIAQLGPDHSTTLFTLQALAEAHRCAATSPRRSPCSSAVRDARIAKLGPDHPDTLTSLNGLGTAYW